MVAMLDKIIKKFSHPHTDKNKRWGKRLAFRAPLILKTSSIYCRIRSRHYKAANLKKSWQQV